MKRLHIVGSARSGTSLMLNLCGTCFRNDGACAHEMTIFSEPEGDPDLYVSKLPADIKRVGLVLDRSPELYVIYMERDPRSVITSIHRIDPEKYFCDFTVWMRSYKAARKMMRNPRFMLVRYEDLTADPNAVQAALQERFRFLEPTLPFRDYHEKARPSFKAEEAMGGTRPISTDRVANWKNHLPRVKDQLLRFPALGRAVVELGYEEDDSWQELLEGVDAVHTPSYFAERDNLVLRLERGWRYRRKAKKFLKKHGA